MKRTFPINLGGKVFYIDEDAYTLLDNYLHNLRATFSDADGTEIVNDIESRIAELFGEKTRRWQRSDFAHRRERND